jgi:hypothetical protein
VAFVGTSPQDLFSCPPPGTCTIRVASNVSSTTDDQVFLAIRLPAPHGPPAAASTNATASGSLPAAADASSGTASAPNGASAAAASGANASAPTTGSKGPSSLAFTGSTTLLAGVGFVLLGLGIAVLSRHAGRRAPA